MYTIDKISIKKSFYSRNSFFAKTGSGAPPKKCHGDADFHSVDLLYCRYLFSALNLLRVTTLSQKNMKVMTLLRYRNSSKLAIPQNSRFIAILTHMEKCPRPEPIFLKLQSWWVPFDSAWIDESFESPNRRVAQLLPEKNVSSGGRGG